MSPIISKAGEKIEQKMKSGEEINIRIIVRMLG